ncbi:glyoxalase superfamily protein [Sphingomonas sp. EC-HK361]|uniref:glyoxalase superfamily protein n=1 Tax=Sphingomonas sp. EC-HK361 TaxID=2038397 RepID=UPI0022784F36|nr:glyoxalase superfamily protein [Sphingomonas sp. EC-HK361]
MGEAPARDAGDQGTDISHSAALELVARLLGHADWNVAAATLPDGDAPAALSFDRAIPVLRSFDEAKAREFYCGFLGFTIQFEHRFEPHMQLYMEVARAGLTLHLSEHHGDASPGSTVFVWMQGITDFQRELIDRHYGYGRPGLNPAPWGTEMVVHDPFGNRIRFCERA